MSEELESNAIECYDCGVFYEDTNECPEAPSEHGYQPVYISDVPLGRDDDAENYHSGRKQWIYNVEE